MGILGLNKIYFMRLRRQLWPEKIITGINRITQGLIPNFVPDRHTNIFHFVWFLISEIFFSKNLTVSPSVFFRF